MDEATDIDSMMQRLGSGPVDLLILDNNLPQAESFRLITRIRKEYPTVHVLIYTVHNELILAGRYLRTGVRGYLLKDSGETEVLGALSTIMAGKIYISDSLARHLADQKVDPRIHSFDSLSNREFEVVLQLVKGYPIAEIARILNMNTSTVRTHKNRVMKKLKVSNSIELITLAQKFQLLR